MFLHESMKIVGILSWHISNANTHMRNVVYERKYNYLWWSTRNPAQHFSDYIWDSGIYDDLGFELMTIKGSYCVYIYSKVLSSTPRGSMGA